MDAELTHNINTNRPQKPPINEVQNKEQEPEILSQTNNRPADGAQLTKEQQGLLQEFRQKINPETVKESQKQNNTSREQNLTGTNTNNNGFQTDNFGQNNDYGMIMTSLEDSTRIPLNAEDLLIQENKLYKILDNIRVQLNFNFVAEEYLEFSHISSLQTLEIFFQNPKIKKIITNSQIFEYTAAMLSVFVYMKGMLTLSTVEHLKNILYYCHQNLILTIELMLKNVCFDYKQNIIYFLNVQQ